MTLEMLTARGQPSSSYHVAEARSTIIASARGRGETGARVMSCVRVCDPYLSAGARSLR